MIPVMEDECNMGIFNKKSRWTEEDLEELDKKFDALCEFLGVEFVFETVSDGSDHGDTERTYCRKKKRNTSPFDELFKMLSQNMGKPMIGMNPVAFRFRQKPDGSLEFMDDDKS